MTSLRIGLTPRDFTGWQGGRELFGLLATGLQAGLATGDRLEIAIGPGDGGLARRLWRNARIGIRHALGRAPPISLDVGDLGLPVDRGGAGCFDVLGPFGVQPRGIVCPWVGYVPDLQHRYLPEMFSARERAARDRNIAALLTHAPVVLVNAAQVADDLRHFFPDGRATIVALPFAPCLDRHWLQDDPDALAADDVARPFFLCSNQFWKHKNHEVVLEAVRLARAAGDPVRILFTGDTSDYRHPGHFRELLAMIAAAGIGDDVEILGFVPKARQIQLMRRAVAVVQPSLFEGAPGGGAAYNAVALGRPVIAADIPVNHAIEGGDVQLFDPLDAGALLAELRSASAAPPREMGRETLLARSDARRLTLGRVLRAAFAAAVSRRDARSE
jgi:glycosyltransferase involved in cell wall biosynthesis